MLFDSNSEVNAIYPTFAKKLKLSIKPINIGAQKIDDITLDMYGIVFIAFLITDKVNQARFFEKTLLVVNVSLKIVFGIFFFILSNAKIDFLNRKL